MNITEKIMAYDGLLAISDVHGEHDMAVAAVDFAAHHNLFPIFLGDLVDGAPQGLATVTLVHSLLEKGTAALIVGNHDDKFARYAKGNPVTLKPYATKTLDEAGKYREHFLQTTHDAVYHPLADNYHWTGNLMFAHGGVHRRIWDDPNHRSSKSRYMSLYGEVDGTVDERNRPIRTYEWVNDVPDGKIAVVGHDREALGKDPLRPAVTVNPRGGRVIFTDTSAGKRDDGVLTGATFTRAKSIFRFDGFESFS